MVLGGGGANVSRGEREKKKKARFQRKIPNQIIPPAQLPVASKREALGLNTFVCDRGHY